MGQIILRGPISGREYVYRTAGEQATVDERQEAQALLRQQETGFAEQYQERFGASALPSRGVGAQVGEFFRGIPRGAGGLFETAALGLATPFGEETELRLREGIRGLGMNLQDRWAPAIGREETVGGRLGEGVGSILGIGGAGLASGLATGNPLVGFGVSMGLGAAAGAGEASERARAFGATQEERNLATRLGVLPGAIEVIPLVRLARVLERGGVLERLRRIALSGGAEGVQEAVSSVAQNLIEQGVYNPEQGTFEGVPEDFGYGAGAGGLVQAILDLAVPGRFRRRVGDGTPPPEAAPDATPPTTPPPGVDPAAFQEQLDLGLPDPVDPLRPGFVAGQDQGELFAPRAQVEPDPVAATEADTAPSAQPEATPGAQPEPARRGPPPPSDDFDVDATVAALRAADGNYVTAMRALGITYPELRQRVRHLESIGRVSFDRAAGKMVFAETETAAQPDTDVRNTTLEPEAQADVAATQETQDAQAAPSRPVGAVDAGDRAGVESGIAELGVGPVPVDADPAGAQPPDGDAVGEPVLGTPQPDAPEGAQPAALTYDQQEFQRLQRSEVREGEIPNRMQPVSDFETYLLAENLPDDVNARVMSEDGPTRIVPISDLRTTQGFISPEGPMTDGPPKVADINDQLVVVDGNNRINEAIRRGESEIEVRVTPVTGAQPAALSDAVPLPLGDGTTAPLVMYDISSPIFPQPARAIVVKPVNGVNVPFYLSTGQGEKADVATGRWYPFFGVTSSGWFVKTSGADINNYYGSEQLRRVAEQLNSELGDVRGQSLPTVTRENDQGLLNAINRDMHPNTALSNKGVLNLPKGQAVHPNDSAGTRAAIQSVLDKIQKAAALRAGAKPIPFDTYEKKPGSQELIPGTNVRGEAPIIDLGGRKIVLVDVNGVQVPFYLSSGRAGKKDVPAGKWYPILGIGSDGWINKGSSKEITSYYGSPKLRAAAEKLDAIVGDIRDDTSVPKVKPSGVHIDAINVGLAPATNAEANTQEVFDKNLANLLARIEQGVSDAPEGAQPGALRPGPGLWASKDFDIPVNIADTPPQAGPDGRLYQQVTDPETGAPSFVPLDELRVSDAPEGAQPAALTPSLERDAIPGQVTGAGPQVIPSPVLRDPAARPVAPEAAAAELVPTTREGMQNVLNDIGINPRGQSAVARAVRGEQTPTPEAFVQALGQARVTGDAKTKRDEWVANARERLRTADPDTTDPRQAAAEEAFQRAAAEDRIAQWFDQNAAPEVKAEYESAPALDRDTTPLPASDLRAVEALLQSTREPTKGRSLTPAQAALRYFGRSPDAGYAFNMIAYDAALADAPQGERGPKTRGPETSILEGQGWGTGQKAQQWIETNLSPETVAAFAALRDGTATRDKAGYRHISYAAKSSQRDRKVAREVAVRAEETRQQREAGVEQRSVERAVMGTVLDAEAAPVTLPRAPWDMMAGQFTWPADAHPRVGALIAAGRFGDAVRVLAATAPNGTMRNLANKLATRIEGVRSQIVAPETMNRIRAAMSPETPTLGVETPSGVYVHPMSPEAIAAMRREGHNEAASIVEEFGGQILFNADAPMAPELVMHEASHAAGDMVLTNKSHPLTRQLDKLRTELLKFMPATHYGLSNVREFFAEGMTNPMFRVELSQATAEGRPRSAWQQFKDIVRNWLRGVLGMQPVKPDTALDAVDRALDAVLAVNPNEMQAGDTLNASFAPGAINRMLKNVTDRMTTTPPAARDRLDRFMQDPHIPQNIRSGFSYFGQGLEFLADNASKYIPSARQLPDLIRQHKGAIEETSNLIKDSLRPFSEVMAKYDSRSDITNAVARVALRGSAAGVNVVDHPLSHYQGYSFRYNQMDAEGNVVKSIESKRYPTEVERNRALQDYNSKLPPDAPRAARARRGYDSSPEDIALYRALEKDYRLLQREAPDVLRELKRMRAIPEKLRERLADALRARIEALAPGDRAKQNKIFNRFYSKITAESLLDYYFALSRQGNYWIEYSGYDSDTGRVEVFKSSFVTPNEQSRAIQMLQRQNERYYARAKELMGDRRPLAEFQQAMERGGELIPQTVADQLIQEGTLSATEVRPYYQSPSDPKVRPPAEMMARIFESLEGVAEAARITDPNTGQTVDIRDQIVELFLDSMPESSFLNTFRKRAGVRGFENDITYLQDTVTAGDLTKNFLQNNSRLANQIVSMEYGAKFQAYRNKIDTEKRTLADRLPASDSMFTRARKLAAAEAYHDALKEHSLAPFRVTGNLAGSLVGLTYAGTLGFNVSTAVLTSMSLPIFYAPYAAGKYGYGKTLGAMGYASRFISGSGRMKQAVRIGQDGQLENFTKQRRLWEVSIDNRDYSQPNMAWMRDAHRFWEERGMFLQSPIQSELLGENPNFIQRLTNYSAVFQHLAERAVRENALVSTYIMELQNQMGDTRSDVNAFIADLEAGRLQPTTEQANAAAAEAITMSEKTNGPMLASMGPRASISDLGRVVYLFKRHPLAMMNNIFQTVSRSFAPDSPDRAIARRQLTGMLSMLALTSGLMGLPMMQQVAMFYNAFLREDDEPDFVTQMRIITGELGTYGALDYLFGTRNSERIGLGGAIYREGFQTGQMPPLFQLMEGFGGPVLGLMLKYGNERTWEHWQEGRYHRFAESVLPTFASNLVRSHRYATEGIQNLRGDILVDDIGPFHIGAQALGFMPASYAQRLAANSVGTRINNAIESEVQRLMRKRNMAIFEGDRETLREVMEEIREFQRRHPGRIDRDTLRSSQRAFLDRSQRTQYGLMVAPRNKAYIDSILDQIGDPSIWAR